MNPTKAKGKATTLNPRDAFIIVGDRLINETSRKSWLENFLLYDQGHPAS